LNDTIFAYIDDDETFAAAVSRWRRCDVVAIDTEFIRTRTFYPIAALYQVATDHEFVLLDPLRLTAWEPFKDLLTDESVVKVMHACSEDLEVFARHLGVAPANLFDTQIAAGFLSTDYSPSYAALVRRYTGVEVTKHETRSDWLARPLRDEQLRYAVLDVAHLLNVYRAQFEEMQRLGRLGWYAEEMRDRVGYAPVDPDQCYRTVSRAWRCDARALARLQMLCAWRERYARDKDLPRGRVIKDDDLVELAALACVDREALFRLLDPATARRHWRELLTIVAQADVQPDDELPEPLPPPLSPSDSRTLKELKSIGAERARELNIAEELLSRRRDLETCLRSVRSEGRLPGNFQGWRRQLVGESFAAVLNGTPPR
jgi:ribonuclease D